MGNDAGYPYSPDLLIGYQGKKAGVFVVSERQAMQDTGEVDGVTAKRLRVLEKA